MYSATFDPIRDPRLTTGLLSGSGSRCALNGLLLGLNLGILDTNGCFTLSSANSSALSTEADTAAPLTASMDTKLPRPWFLETVRSTEAD